MEAAVRTRRILWLFLTSIVCADADNTFQTKVGIYHWGEQYPASVSGGVEQIAALGGRIARISLSPRSNIDYQAGTACIRNFSLKSFAQEPDIKAALDNPAIDIYIFTAYDGTSFSDCVHQDFLVPAFYTPENRARIVQEYADLTLYLNQTYVGTHKQFIISNWEGDNAIYCGQAYTYATDAGFRSACDTGYPQLYGGNLSPDDSFAGLKQWFDARLQGVTSGQESAAAMGIGEARVYLAPEFCIVRALRDQGFKSVLYDLLPTVSFDFVSYSAWESINQPDPGGALIADLNTIREVIGSSAIIVGEFGFSRSQWGDQVSSLTDQVAAAALSWGVAYLIQWNLYDQGLSNDFGLFDSFGNRMPLASYYQERFLRGGSSGTAGHPGVR
jgi:hypothetical protein